MKLVSLPTGISWLDILGVGIIAGIGFTMSILVASLAFVNYEILVSIKLGILISLIISSISGWIVLKYSFKRNKESLNA